MKAKAAVLEQFNEPLHVREFEVSDPAEGEVIVKITAAGVCGSDIHMWEGRDPRTPLPIIPGHEGVGVIEKTGGGKFDIFGEKLKEGDPVMWERGIMCGKCYYCVIKKQPALCPERKTYGLSVGCADAPHLQGCYADYLHLKANTHMIKLDTHASHTTLAAASCSGATAANTVEQCRISPGDAVVVQGPGPLGLFSVAFAMEQGASDVIVIGTARGRRRLELCREFGATHTLIMDETTEDERREFVLDITNGRGADVVLDCAGTAGAVTEGVKLTAPYGVYSMPGVATPIGDITLKAFEDIARRNVRIQGIWVSDTSHLYRAIRLVESGKYPFEKIITHKYTLDKATTAMQKMRNREAMKATLTPGD